MLIAAVGQYFFGIAIFVSSMFLIMLVLVQRGRGGGLAGALGGPGGQSAFGTKAGDLFTRITIGVAGFWILLCVIAVMALKEKTLDTGVDRPSSTIQSRDGASDRDAFVPPVDGLSPGATAIPPTGPIVPPSGSPPIDLTPASPAAADSPVVPSTEATGPATTQGAEVTELAPEGDSGAETGAEDDGDSAASGDEGAAAPGEDFPENTLRPAEANDPPASQP